MDIQVLGVSGSPVPNSNTDWAVRKILKYTGLEWRFVKLSDYNIQPCSACLGCVESNECTTRDDGRELARLFNQARAFVIGGYTPFSSLDARTKTFMERMFCLRHQGGLNRGKVGASVITTATPPERGDLPPAAEIATRQIEYWMAEEGMVNIGTLMILGNVPCIRCGHGDDCAMSGVKILEGPQATVASAPVHFPDADPKFDDAAREVGERIRQAVLALGAATRREAV